MDLKRYEKISGDEALVKLLAGERIYNRAESCWIRKEERILVEYEGEDGESDSTIPVSWFVNGTTDWYVKKPFDVRKEMLERPDEWVGAYKDEQGNWCKVKFNSEAMTAQDTVINYKASVFRTEVDELNKCIPIEDVPKEELK